MGQDGQIMILPQVIQAQGPHGQLQILPSSTGHSSGFSSAEQQTPIQQLQKHRIFIQMSDGQIYMYQPSGIDNQGLQSAQQLRGYFEIF